MERLTDISTVKDILSRHGFTFSKALGQNFLINPSVCPRMAEAAVQGDRVGVLEIGPGIGVLTKELLERAGKVVAVELDKRLLPVLSETLGAYDNLKVVNADVLELDLHKLITDEFGGMDVVEKEAAVRLCAEPGTRDSSAITVAVRYYCDPELLFHVSSGSFMPAPKVDSAVIQLHLHEPVVQPKNEATFFKVIKGAFAQRRKTVLNSLSSSLSLDKNAVRDILKAAGVEETARAERLTLENFADISNALDDRSK